MRLKGIELSGFRGSKNEVTIPIGRGFTVITGRNGSGKSSICDAVEYVLTRHLTRFSPSDVEGGERIEDYIWWRDGSRASNRHVKAVFELDDGSEGIRTATPDKIDSTFNDSLFYETESHPPNPLALLTQTMLIRDESIVKFSTDLPEADRFDLFYKAIGLTDLVKIERRANSIVEQLKHRSNGLEKEYRTRRDAVAQVISEISEARTLASQAGASDVAVTQKNLALLAGLSPDTSSLREIVAKVNQILPDQKRRVTALVRLASDLAESTKRREQLLELENRCAVAKRNADEAEMRLKQAADARLKAAELLKGAQTHSPRIGELAQLREYGSRVSLQDGHCPLCGSAVSDADFNAHLQELQQQVESHSTMLNQLTTSEANSDGDYQKRRDEFQARSLEYSRALSDAETLKSAIQQLQSEATALGVQMDVISVESELKQCRARIAEMDSGLLQLEGSRAFNRIADLEKQRAIAESHADAIAKQIELLSQISQNAKAAVDTTKRVSWESVDDCLAALSPLLSELFLRLKPHVDYSEVRYHMRGDIKRFLSFEIGKGINPRFTFSSGQRRVLGIAFLLAVHLSRRWCKLRTLVLDDPVQHIDDYRALHFAEVLSSVRQMGHQIICTVEDSALADLLCRRLRSANLGDGMRIEMEYEPGAGAKVKEARQIGPLPERVLLSA